ncbi:ABC transporter permease subunit [Clostridium sp. AF19-22AC]|jgi:tungstate transport system permease protein|uniref:ABC transporter permease n=1 Tax=Clostridia TaxID=186801 RepID=UPI000E4AA7EB|nr:MULTISPECIES: ABC transporter permease [Clostridia]RHR31945.1 ABC transporter permease subunit [Clostridium sp. AF19-22AC]
MLEWLKSVVSDAGIISAVKVTFIMAVSSTAISSVLGILFGLLLERFSFPGKKIIVRINRTLMGVPPVVAGLVVYLLIMRRGPLGPLSLLFTIKGMVIAQVLIITPIISGMIYSYARKSAPSIRVFAVTMGATRWQTAKLIIRELRKEIYFCMVTGFGRSISEVGAVMLVGGNIKGRTRTMTTTISLLKSQGIFTEGVALGILLLVMAFILQWICDLLQKEGEEDENY